MERELEIMNLELIQLRRDLDDETSRHQNKLRFLLSEHAEVCKRINKDIEILEAKIRKSTRNYGGQGVYPFQGQSRLAPHLFQQEQFYPMSQQVRGVGGGHNQGGAHGFASQGEVQTNQGGIGGNIPCQYFDQYRPELNQGQPPSFSQDFSIGSQNPGQETPPSGFPGNQLVFPQPYYQQRLLSQQRLEMQFPQGGGQNQGGCPTHLPISTHSQPPIQGLGPAMYPAANSQDQHRSHGGFGGQGSIMQFKNSPVHLSPEKAYDLEFDFSKMD